MAIDIKNISDTILASNAQWLARDNWMTLLADSDRRALLGVKVDSADLSRIELAAAAKPKTASLTPLPVRVDWRSNNGNNLVSDVKDQGGCGSCVSFGTIAIVESAAAIERNQRFLDLSEADLHFCSSHGPTCGGWWPSAALDEIKARGVVGEADLPYVQGFNGGSPRCLPVPDRDRKITKITSWSTLSTMYERKKWLVEQGPITACHHVYEDFFAYRSGVYRHVSGGEVGYHCVAVVGYDDSLSCWICKNSWGRNWGDGGYFCIAYGECGIDDTSNDKDSAGNTLRLPMWGVDAVVLPPPARPQLTTIESAINSDGRLEVFGINRADQLSVWNLWQSRPAAGPWYGWGDLNGSLKKITSARNGDGRLEVFGIGMGDGLWHTWQTQPAAGPWSGWNPLGGQVKQIVAATNADGRLEVFAIGMDDGLYNIWQTRPSTGPWSGWNSLGGRVKKIDVARNSDGRLEVFGIGMDDALYNMWQTRPAAGPWSGWNRLGGGIKALEATINSDGRLEVFGIGMGDGLWNIWQTRPSAGPWSGWNRLG